MPCIEKGLQRQQGVVLLVGSQELTGILIPGHEKGLQGQKGVALLVDSLGQRALIVP